MALAVLGTVALAAAYWVFGRAPTPELARFVPKDAQLYVELPDVRRALIAATRVDIFDTKSASAEGQLTDVAYALSESFDVDDEKAKALLGGIEGVAFAARAGGETLVLVRVRDAALVEPFLKAARIDKDDPLPGATRLQLRRKKPDDKGSRRQPKEIERFFDRLHTTPSLAKGERPPWRVTALSFLPEERLIAFGDLAMVDEVGRIARGDRGNLAEDNARFHETAYRSQGVALAYADFAAFDDEEAARELFHDVTPFTATAAFSEAGLLTRYRLQLAGTRIPASLHLPHPHPLTLPRRLPDNTVAYVAASLDFGVDGKAVLRDALTLADDLNPREAAQLERELDRFDERFDINPELVLDALGGEAVVGVVASDKTDLMKLDTGSELVAHVGLVGVFEVRDKSKAEKLVRRVRDLIEKEAGDAYEVKKKDGGILAVPSIEREERSPHVWLSLEEDERYLLLVVASKRRIGAIRDAFAGFEPTLGEDAAHARAVAALPGQPQIVAWADLGRVGAHLFELPGLRAELRTLGLDLDVFRLEGEKRVGAVMSLSAKHDGRALTLELDEINAALLGGAFALAEEGLSRASRAEPREPTELFEPSLPKTAEPAIPSPAPTGMSDCDQYIQKIEACATQSSDPSMKQAMKESAKTLRKTYADLALDPAARNAVNAACKQASDAFVLSVCN